MGLFGKKKEDKIIRGIKKENKGFFGFGRKKQEKTSELEEILPAPIPPFKRFTKEFNIPEPPLSNANENSGVMGIKASSETEKSDDYWKELDDRDLEELPELPEFPELPGLSGLPKPESIKVNEAEKSMTMPIERLTVDMSSISQPQQKISSYKQYKSVSVVPVIQQRNNGKFEKQVYVKVEKFDDASSILKDVKEKTKKISAMLEKLKYSREREEFEIKKLEDDFQKIKDKLNSIDQKLFGRE